MLVIIRGFALLIYINLLEDNTFTVLKFMPTLQNSKVVDYYIPQIYNTLFNFKGVI